MIRIAYRKTRDVIEIRARGHSGTAEKGRDVVCAAVSALVCTFAVVLDNYAEACGAGDDIKIEMEDGRAYIRADRPSAYLEVAAETILTGLIKTADQWPEAVTVVELKKRGVRDDDK